MSTARAHAHLGAVATSLLQGAAPTLRRAGWCLVVVVCAGSWWAKLEVGSPCRPHPDRG